MSISSSVQTISSLSNEVWNMVLLRKEKVIMLGTNNDEIVLLRFNPTHDPLTNQKKYIEFIGNFKKQSFSRPLQMELSHDQTLLFVMSKKYFKHALEILTKLYY